jgi:hypothetical protein
LGFWCGPIDYGNGWGLRIFFLFWELCVTRIGRNPIDYYLGKAV